MIEYVSTEEAIHGRGLRLVMVRGIASPWNVAAKTLLEIKGLDFVIAPWDAGEPNEAYVNWSGSHSAPIVAWEDESPLNRWVDILYLAERLAPDPPLVPAEVEERAVMLGLSHELCGERGLGWNRRLQLFRPIVESGEAPEGVRRMCRKYRYDPEELDFADRAVPQQLQALAERLKAQYAVDRHFLVGNALTAADVYFTAFMSLIHLLPKEQCPMSDEWRAVYMYGMDEPSMREAVDPILIEHRDRIFERYFRNPMEF